MDAILTNTNEIEKRLSQLFKLSYELKMNLINSRGRTIYLGVKDEMESGEFR